MRVQAAFAVLLFACSVYGQQATRGHLVLIGGGEKPPEAMEKFISLAGGRQAPIIVIPTASSDADVVPYYENLFRKDFACTDVAVLDIKSKADARKPEFVAAAKRARGIFFGGGDQIRILGALEGTPVLDAIRNAYEHGAAVGGTSAGTACQSRIMITGEGDFKVIRSRSVETWDGLGFLPHDVVVDQHFIQRQRSNRLLSVILEHPEDIGVGIDEDTAIWVRPNDTFEVMGANSVMVIDARGARVTRKARDTGQDLLGAHDLRLQILLPGELFDLKSRKIIRKSN